MDYLVGFLLGYYTPRFFNWLKELAEVKLPNNYLKEVNNCKKLFDIMNIQYSPTLTEPGVKYFLKETLNTLFKKNGTYFLKLNVFQS